MGIAPKPIPAIDVAAFFSKILVSQETGCWNWTGGQDGKGYGKFDHYINGKRVRYFTHRVSWSIFKGNPNPQMVNDHSCKNRACCNPDHLAEKPRGLNSIENSDSPPAKNKIKTHCWRGHELTIENVRMNASNGRVCRKCAAIRTAIRRKNKKELKK